MDDPSQTWPTLTVAFGLVAWVAAVRFQRGPVLAPFSLSLLMLVAIYGIRPLLMIHYGTYDIYGLDVVTGFNATARIGFVATVVFCGGYWLSRSTMRPLPSLPVDVPAGREPPGVAAAAAVCLGTVAAWFAAIAAIGGPGFIRLLFRGRSAEATAIFGSTPSAVYCLPIAGAVLVAAARIRTRQTRRLTAWETVLFWVAIAGSTVPATSQGGRRFLVPCLLVALLAVVYPRWWRPVTAPMVLFSGAALLVLAAIPYVRSAGARTDRTDFVGALGDYLGQAGIGGTFKSLFLSYDTDSFGYVSFVEPRLGGSLPYGYGRSTVGDLLVNPLPGTWATSWADRMLTDIFGGGCASGKCPIPSVVGVLLFDAGAATVVAGMLLLGFLFGRYDRALLRARSYRLPALLIVGGFAPVFTRGSSANVAWLAVNVFVLAAVLWRFAGRKVPASSLEPVPARV
jgi:hypothetical protein